MGGFVNTRRRIMVNILECEKYKVIGGWNCVVEFSASCGVLLLRIGHGDGVE